MNGLRVGVVGATGAVGRELLTTLAMRHPSGPPPRAFASTPSAGTRVAFGVETLVVEAAGPEIFADLDLAFLSAGAELSRALAPEAVRHGCLVIDNSSAYRDDPEVPLVVPEINGAAAARHRGIVANPNCTTIVNLMIAGPLHAHFGLRRMVVSSYQAASGAGRRGLDALLTGTRAVLDGDEPEAGAFPEPLPFNFIPEIGGPADAGETGEELKMRTESRKILGAPDLEVFSTCVRVPVLRCHGVSTVAWFDRDASPEAAEAVLRAAPGVIWSDRPTARQATESDAILVGRLRRVPFDGPPALAWFAVGDQLQKGAALNAIQIAERLFA